MRTKFGFDFVTTAAPDQVIELMTDFSPNRPHRWPASSVKAFEVYHLGETDIREGQEFPKLWATWHYDWSTAGTVTLTVVASDAMAAGGNGDTDGTGRGGGGGIRRRRGLTRGRYRLPPPLRCKRPSGATHDVSAVIGCTGNSLHGLATSEATNYPLSE